MAFEGILERKFLKRALGDFLSESSNEMRNAIRRTKSVDKELLVNSIRFAVRNSGQNGVEGELIFDEVGRYLDIGVNRHNPLGNNKGFKRRKIYASIVWGKLNGLIGEVQYGLTEDVVRELKNELTNGS